MLWLVSSASRLWISISALIFGKDTTQSWDFFGLHGTQLIGVLAILFMIGMNLVFILSSLIVIIMNHGQLAQPINGLQSFIVSPNKDFQTPITIISFVVYAVFAYGNMETVGGVIDSMKHPEKDFPKGLIIGSLFTIISWDLTQDYGLRLLLS